jgi:hypothetical protein
MIFGMYGLPILYAVFPRYTVYQKELNMIYERPLNPSWVIKKNILDCLDESIRAGISAITMLCGYMVIFNLLNILPYYVFHKEGSVIAPLLEITGGILLNSNLPLIYILIILPMGGISCIAQTNNIIKDSPLNLNEYLIHKFILTIISAVYYLSLKHFGVINL